MSIETWLGFIAAAAVLLIIPGPTILAVISYSISHGRRAKLPLVAAVTLGDSTALVLSLVGLGAVLRASAAWFAVIKIAGGLYLLYLGMKMLRTGVSPIERLTLIATLKALESQLLNGDRPAAQLTRFAIISRLEDEQLDYDSHMELEFEQRLLTARFYRDAA